MFLDSSMVEHSAINRVVVGSSPTRGLVGTPDGYFRWQVDEDAGVAYFRVGEMPTIGD